VNIGIAPCDTEYDTPEEILRDADIAMHFAKEKEDGFAVFTKELRFRFLEQIRAVRAPIPTPDVVMKFSRRDLTGLLANVLEGVVADAQRVEQRQPAEG